MPGLRLVFELLSKVYPWCSLVPMLLQDPRVYPTRFREALLDQSVRGVGRSENGVNVKDTA
jgi:hypothetical protein